MAYRDWDVFNRPNEIEDSLEVRGGRERESVIDGSLKVRLSTRARKQCAP